MNLYCPALSVVVCAIWVKVDCPESSRHSATVTPDGGGLLVRPPEITTFRPAVDGSGEEAIVNVPDVHWAQQAVVQQVVVQHVVVQQAVVQQVPVDGQQGVEGVAPEDAGRFGPLTGVGQHGTIVARSRCWGRLCAVYFRPRRQGRASPGRTARRRGQERRRNDQAAHRRKTAQSLPVFVKTNAVL